MLTTLIHGLHAYFKLDCLNIGCSENISMSFTYAEVIGDYKSKKKISISLSFSIHLYFGQRSYVTIYLATPIVTVFYILFPYFGIIYTAGRVYSITCLLCFSVLSRNQKSYIGNTKVIFQGASRWISS